jgi:hypothetical protein
MGSPRSETRLAVGFPSRAAPCRSRHARQAACHAALRRHLRKTRRNSEGPPIDEPPGQRSANKINNLWANWPVPSYLTCRLRDDPEKNYPPDSRSVTAEVRLPLAGIQSGLIENSPNATPPSVGGREAARGEGASHACGRAMFGCARDCGQREGNRVIALEIIDELSGTWLWMGRVDSDA